MSLHLEFEPHSWYKGFAIVDNRTSEWAKQGKEDNWEAYTENGMTGHLDTVGGATLKELKELITRYDNDRKAYMAYLYRERNI